MSIYQECRTVMLMSIPLIIGQLGQMLLGVADTMMVGDICVDAVAALSLGSNISVIFLVLGIGILTCVSVRTSMAKGANTPKEARNVCKNGVYLGLGIGIIFFVVTWLSTPLLYSFGSLKTSVLDDAKIYLLIIMASMIPAMIGIALKNHADALNFIWQAFWINIAGVALNIFLNYLLIYGKLGAPELGLEGAGWATLIARVAIVIGMLVWFFNDKRLTDWVPHHWFSKLNPKQIKSLLKLGFPSGLQSCSEVSAFAGAGLIIAEFGEVTLAAHQIALTIAGVAFMIPLGLSIALTIRVGETVGNNQKSYLHTIYLSGWGMACFFSVLSALAFFIFGETFTSFFLNEPHIITFSASLLFIAGVFQIVDGQQIVSVGMLRGLEDTAVPAVFGIVSYWVVGIPTGCYLAFALDMKAHGIWWGLAIGLTCASILLGARLWKKRPRTTAA